MNSPAAPTVSPTPRSLSISITGRCNLRCRYCFYANEMHALRDLSTGQWLEFFRRAREWKIFDISLTGGEVFTRPDLFELIDGIIENKMRYNLLSNGTLIDEGVIEQLSRGKRKKRLDYIQISIDGSCAEIHNRSRPDSFDRAVRGLKLLKENGFPLAVRTTINRHNLEDLENIAEFLLEDIGVSSFGTNEAMPIGTGCQSAKEIALSPRDQRRAMGIMKKLLQKYPGRLNAQAGPQAKLKMYDEMERARKGEKVKTNWKMGYLSACGCVFSRIDILHDGSIVPCCMLPGLKLGNIQRDPVDKIWQQHPVMRAMRDRRRIPMREVPGCEDCEWNPYCNGSCPGLAHQLTGDFNRANPEDCFRRFLRENQLKEFKDAI